MREMLAGMADGEPHPIAALDRLLADLVAHHGIVGPGIGALFALCALAVLLPPRLAKPLYALAMLLAAITWLGQDFGGILSGQGTDPNSGPLLFLLALAYWPLRPQPAPALATTTRRPVPLLRIGVSSAAATLIAASSVAAATGLTTATATASAGHRTLSLQSGRMVGPGSVRSRYRLAGYRILFRDTRNQATHPGLVSIRLERRGQPVDSAEVQLTYHSLDMNMATHTIRLQPHNLGRYSHQGPLLGMGGRWQITVSVLLHQGPALQISLTDLIAR